MLGDISSATNIYIICGYSQDIFILIFLDNPAIPRRFALKYEDKKFCAIMKSL